MISKNSQKKLFKPNWMTFEEHGLQKKGGGLFKNMFRFFIEH